MKLGIIGFGVVGAALLRTLSRNGAHTLAVYDKYLPDHSSASALRALQDADLVFIAVPTPYDQTSGRCDLTAVIDAVHLAGSTPICVKSTIPPGTIEALKACSRAPIAFSPEYIGESPGHPWPDVGDCGFVIVAGDDVPCELVRRAFEGNVAARCRFVRATVACAELVKYMENNFLAMKVAFMNQFYDIAAAAGADFEELRELFLLDDRIGTSHTVVTAERGFGGRCLPKDLASLIGWAEGRVGVPLLEAVQDYNDALTAVRD